MLNKERKKKKKRIKWVSQSLPFQYIKMKTIKHAKPAKQTSM